MMGQLMALPNISKVSSKNKLFSINLGTKFRKTSKENML